VSLLAGVFSGILVAMIIDGNAIAEEIYAGLKNEVTHLSHAPHLTVITCAPAFATQKYIGLKKRKAAEVGIQVEVIELPEIATTEDLVAVVQRVQLQTDGIIVQLPLPAHIDTEVVLAAIPVSLDVDGMHYAATGEGYLPPVVGAIAELIHRHDMLLVGQEVVVVGQGRLVGLPAARFVANQGARVTVLTKESEHQAVIIGQADVLILGTGVPGLIVPDMVKTGVVIFDAGTAEDNGELVGDADPACAVKARLFTPVPGGIGPLTVSALLRNVVLAVA
jgi:methylenetetrahydrofolate dehydrogenase (NADP+) / methenyltetrahydrofolate cyclohydrolase